MNTDSKAVALHNKSTRGQELSAEEQTYLEQWYAAQDQVENSLLGCASAPRSLTELQERVNASMAQVPVAIQHIQQLAAANDSLRQEIAEYKQKLTQTAASQAS